MSKYENLKLDYQLCFALYAATHAITRAYRTPLEHIGLTYTQYLVMLVLWEQDKVSVGHIANRLELDSATLTPILKKLEVAGFITRTRNPSDERSVVIRLTKAGTNIQEETAKIQHGVACKTQLNTDQYEHLKSTLHHLVSTMSQTEDEAAEPKE